MDTHYSSRHDVIGAGMAGHRAALEAFQLSKTSNGENHELA